MTKKSAMYALGVKLAAEGMGASFSSVRPFVMALDDVAVPFLLRHLPGQQNNPQQKPK